MLLDHKHVCGWNGGEGDSWKELADLLRRDCGAISGTVRVLAFITKSTRGQRCFVNLELEISSLSEAVAASQHARQKGDQAESESCCIFAIVAIVAIALSFRFLFVSFRENIVYVDQRLPKCLHGNQKLKKGGYDEFACFPQNKHGTPHSPPARVLVLPAYQKRFCLYMIATSKFSMCFCKLWEERRLGQNKESRGVQQFKPVLDSICSNSLHTQNSHLAGSRLFGVLLRWLPRWDPRSRGSLGNPAGLQMAWSGTLCGSLCKIDQNCATCIYCIHQNKR